MAKKQKYYVVWKGVNPGVYDSWTDCQLQIKGYDGAQYKSFETKEEAEHALASSAFHYIGKNAVKKEDVPKQLPENFDMNCLAVDAACSGIPDRWNIGAFICLPDRRFFISVLFMERIILESFLPLSMLWR